MAKKITVIPSVSESLHTQMKPRIRVCGYARVSTASMAQADSYAAQVGYYTEKIQSNPLWEFAGVYADEGITGTKAKGRYDFNEMIAACEDGDIDLILTKSITRFARNTVDCIQTIRKLKAIGVGITFEKENINTLEEKSELLLTIMASVAQGESEDFSGNNRWAVISRFEKGTFIVGTPAYGYRKDEDGNLMIEEKEAEVVRLIFESYLNGTGTYLISKMLNEQSIPTIRESEQWQDSVIKEILKNPVYEGDALRQRTYTEKQFPFVRRGNTGQMPMYLTRDAHPAIVTHEEAEAVKSIMEYRSRTLHMGGEKCQNRYLFSSRIICGECGSPYRRVIWTQKGVKRVVWRCQNRLEHGRKICKHSPTLDEGDIHDAVISAMNELFQTQVARNAVKASISAVLAGEEQTLSLPAVELQIRNLQERQLELFQLIVSAGADCTDYDEELRQVNMAKTKLMAKKAELEKEQRGAAAFEERLAELDAELEQSCGALTDFDELTVRQLVSNIKVLDKDSLLICFKDGTEITQAMQRRQTA